MSEKKLVIVENKPEVVSHFGELLSQQNLHYTVIQSASELETVSGADLVLFSFSFLSRVSREAISETFKWARKKHFIIYDVPQDATKHIALYKLGAFKIFSSSYYKEEIATYVRNISQMQLSDAKMPDSRINGNLQNIQLSELIHSFIKEKVSGILYLKTDFCSGKIIFNNGDIDDAAAGFLKNEDAVFFMLSWQRGVFTMRKTEIKLPRHRIQLSPIGLLLKSNEIIELLGSKMSELGKGEFQIRIKNKGDLLHELKNNPKLDLLAKMADFKSINEILAYSSFPVLDTISWLIDLKQSNHLDIKDEIGFNLTDLKFKASGLAERFFKTDEVTQLKHQLSANKIGSGKVLLLATNNQDKSNFIQTLNMGSLSDIQTERNIDFTQMDIDDEFKLVVFGLSLDKKLTDTIKKIAEGLLGYIFLINTDQEHDIEYFNYIANFLISKYNVPWTIAYTGEKQEIKNIRLPEERVPLKCYPEKKDSVKQVLLAIMETGGTQ